MSEHGPGNGRAAPKGSGERSPLPKRFYGAAATELRGRDHHLTLDGRTTRTPARSPLAVQSASLAEALAREWNAQVDVIDPAAMPLTRLANTAIDGVATQVEDVRADIARYAGSDLVCYRAGEPDSLVAAQAQAWDPILRWARDRLGAPFVMSVGIVYVQQPEAALAAIRGALEGEDSPFALAPLHVLTTLTGSVLIALMLADGAIGEEGAWRAAHVDEVHQEIRWGEDYDASERRKVRRAEFANAAEFLRLARDG